MQCTYVEVQPSIWMAKVGPIICVQLALVVKTTTLSSIHDFFQLLMTRVDFSSKISSINTIVTNASWIYDYKLSRPLHDGVAAYLTICTCDY